MNKLFRKNDRYKKAGLSTFFIRVVNQMIKGYSTENYAITNSYNHKFDILIMEEMLRINYVFVSSNFYRLIFKRKKSE